MTARRKTAERTALYRIWGDAELLLYIGISNSFGKRWQAHARTQPWWGEMRRLTADEWFDDRKDAEAAEAAAIKAERPKYNKVHAVPAGRTAQPRPQEQKQSNAHPPRPFRDCNCRDRETGKKLHSKCPRMSAEDHGAWYARIAVPKGAIDWDPARKRNQRTLGPFMSRKEAADELARVLNDYARSGLRVLRLPRQRGGRSAA